MSLTKPFSGKPGENGSNTSNGGGSGNNSDNSAVISLGNTSFGFNFDSEDGGMNNLQSNSNNSEAGDSDGSNQASGGKSKVQSSIKVETTTVPLVESSKQDIASSSSPPHDAANVPLTVQTDGNKNAAPSNSGNVKASLKRKAQESMDSDNRGYNCDDEGRRVQTSTRIEPSRSNLETETSHGTIHKGGRKKKKMDDSKREERNAREKERSFRISKQIGELRGLLSTGGVIVPKGTKSSVLTEAANYIRLLQQHHYRSEIDRHQLVQQIQMIGGGALGQQAANTVRHVAAQNGVWSLGNFGGMPPKSAMAYHEPSMTEAADNGNTAGAQQSSDGSLLQNMIKETDYRFVFNSCTVGMAIASMGGAFVDCNRLFSQLSDYTKREVCSMTIFNLTFRDDLQTAFDMISQMLQPSGPSSGEPTTCKLRGAMKHRTDLGLSVTLIKGEDGVAKCFCITLIHNPKGPYDPERPIPATSEMIQPTPDVQLSKSQESVIDQSPRYTTG